MAYTVWETCPGSGSTTENVCCNVCGGFPGTIHFKGRRVFVTHKRAVVVQPPLKGIGSVGRPS